MIKIAIKCYGSLLMKNNHNYRMGKGNDKEVVGEKA
jgi:hypothetical protein